MTHLETIRLTGRADSGGAISRKIAESRRLAKADLEAGEVEARRAKAEGKTKEMLDQADKLVAEAAKLEAEAKALLAKLEAEAKALRAKAAELQKAADAELAKGQYPVHPQEKRRPGRDGRRRMWAA